MKKVKALAIELARRFRRMRQRVAKQTSGKVGDWPKNNGEVRFCDQGHRTLTWFCPDPLCFCHICGSTTTVWFRGKDTPVPVPFEPTSHRMEVVCINRIHHYNNEPVRVPIYDVSRVPSVAWEVGPEKPSEAAVVW